jgi:prolyl oligopeptidase
MSRHLAALVSLIAILSACSPAPQPADELAYPTSHTVGVVETLHGQQVPDPYRWLEDLDSEETHAWVEAQNQVTFAYLESIPARDRIRDRLTTLWDYQRFGVPRAEGKHYFYARNDGLQPQSVLLVADSIEGEPRVLLDPNTLSEDGTVALTSFRVSPDGRWLAYGTASGGSDWQEWRVREVATGQDLDDRLMWIKFSSPSWNHDSTGLFYARYNEPAAGEELADINRVNKLFFHPLGTPQADDALVYERPDQPDWSFSAHVTEDGRYLVIDVSLGSDRRNLMFYRDLSADGPVVELIKEPPVALFRFLANDGPVFYLRTDFEAPRGRVIAIDTRKPDPGSWREVIPEDEDILESVDVIHDTFIASYLHDAHNQVRLHAMDGKRSGVVDLPGIGSVGGFTGRSFHTETFFSFESSTTPRSIYHLDMTTGESTLLRTPEVAFSADDFTTEQVFVTSKDGTRVPMFLSFRKGLERDGSNPALLYGYGGFRVSLSPFFSIANIVWMEMGGIYAQVCLRGGGEYGKEWHDAGRLANKQNVFDDCIAAAEWLIANRYTSTDRLALQGASNGGLLVGAVINQRPDLFAAAIPEVGVMDMLRFHKFTIGWAWVSDYGSPDDPEMFPILHGYSPLHNIRSGLDYPAVLIVTADHDDRVVPAHSFKYACAIQAVDTGPRPKLIRIETRAGHGAGKPTAKRIEEATDLLAFLGRELEMSAIERELATAAGG